MRYLLNAIILFSLFISLSCGNVNKNDTTRNFLINVYQGDTLRIDFNTGFIDDTVIIFKQDKVVYNNVISTNEVLGLSDWYIISDFKEKDSSVYSVQVNDTVVNLTLNKEMRYTHIYKNSNGIKIIKQRFPFIYN